jgi:hypothetical protein
MASKMRLMTFLAGWMGVSLAQAAGLGGTYVMEGQGGSIMARLEEGRRNVQGYIDLAGKTSDHLERNGQRPDHPRSHGCILHLLLSQMDGPGVRSAPATITSPPHAVT